MPLVHAWPQPCPLTVTCLGCGETAQTYDYQHPDRAVACSCCPLDHDHAEAAECPREHEGTCGKGVPGCNVCRPVNVSGCAHLRMFEVADLLEMADVTPAAIPGSAPGEVKDGGRVGVH